MIEHGKTQSVVMPEAVEITETKVFVASNIETVEQVIDGVSVTLYEVDYTESEKDEYIKALEAEVTETQLALCDVYELIAGGAE